ncbi:MAG TPA: SPFH domain-containing protein [Thermoleophilaceae bacterium]|nr:SPFH domain-containing protein [Thermoleophilaceae bacterium]
MKFPWQVPAPDEALLISGSKHRDAETQFRIVTGHGALVVPIKQKSRMLSLALREAEIVETCVTSQGIPLELRAVAFFKVGDDAKSIANAARRFLTEQNEMEELCGRIFAGHLRSIVGGLTVEEIIRERDRVAQEVKEGSHIEMEKLGIVVDGLQIQEITDPTGYIQNLAAPHAAAVAAAARIAAAERDQEAAEKEQQAARAKAQFARETSIQQAQIEAEVQQAQARASQAGPLAEAKASQDVISEQTAVAEKQAALTDRRLESEVRRPADAEAYRQRTLAEAARDTTKLNTEAEAFRRRGLAEASRDTTKLESEAEAGRRKTLADADAHAARVVAAADAEAIDARAQALAGENQALIAANKLVDMLPALVEASAKGIEGSKLTILSGTNGVNEVATGLVAQGLSIYETLRGAVGHSPNGQPPNEGASEPGAGA